MKYTTPETTKRENLELAIYHHVWPIKISPTIPTQWSSLEHFANIFESSQYFHASRDGPVRIVADTYFQGAPLQKFGQLWSCLVILECKYGFTTQERKYTQL